MPKVHGLAKEMFAVCYGIGVPLWRQINQFCHMRVMPLAIPEESMRALQIGIDRGLFPFWEDLVGRGRLSERLKNRQATPC